MRSGEITQEYDQHLGPVNTITFVDENRRFITSSDDKTMRVWDFDIPVPIKLIADPTMHSMPAVGLHPNGKVAFLKVRKVINITDFLDLPFLQVNGWQLLVWITKSSCSELILSNKTCVLHSTFSSSSTHQLNRFLLCILLSSQRKKRFAGHTIAGYACEPRFSPDGRYVSSGDGTGDMIFWDFKTSRIVSRIKKAHSKVIISHAWLPHESVCDLAPLRWDYAKKTD
jgi:pre-mRNA-processing factor 17